MQRFLTVVPSTHINNESDNVTTETEIPKINILPTCWADFDLSSLLHREDLTDPFIKLKSIRNSLGLADTPNEEEQIWNGKYFIPEFEEELPSSEMQEKYLMSLIIKQSARLKTFNATLPASEAMHKRLEIIKVFMKTLYNKYHKQQQQASKNSKAQQRRSALAEQLESEKDEKSENNILLELGVKTIMTTMFSLLRRSLSSSDEHMNHLCKDILQPCSAMMLALPNLALSNESRLSKSAVIGLTDVMSFLVELMEPTNNSDNDSKRYACEILLGLSLQRGSVTYLLKWIELCLSNSLDHSKNRSDDTSEKTISPNKASENKSDETPGSRLEDSSESSIAGYQFNHWMTCLISTKEQVR